MSFLQCRRVRDIGARPLPAQVGGTEFWYPSEALERVGTAADDASRVAAEKARQRAKMVKSAQVGPTPRMWTALQHNGPNHLEFRVQ